MGTTCGNFCIENDGNPLAVSFELGGTLFSGKLIVIIYIYIYNIIYIYIDVLTSHLSHVGLDSNN